jgi:broad specificity phosphatase PhoE
VTTVLIVRHGETDWNSARRWQGHADPPLNARGREQARELRDRLAAVPLDAVYASDLQRAIDTAAAVAEPRGLHVVADHELREIDVGEWSGLTTAEIEERYPAGFARHLAGGDGWEDGEPHAAMSARVTAAVERIAAGHPGGQVLCVLHGGTIRALLARAEGIDLAEYRRTRRGPVNGGVATLSVQDGALGLLAADPPPESRTE